LTSLKLSETQKQIDNLVDKSNSLIGIEIISLRDRTTLYSHQAHKHFVPASSQKLFTALAALCILKPHDCWETQVFIDESGHLYLKASGDPLLSDYDLQDLALEVALAADLPPSGQLVLDLSIFDAVAKGPGWMWDEPAAYWNSPLSSLTINHSCAQILVSPSEIGQPPRALVYPENCGVTLNNTAITSSTELNLSPLGLNLIPPATGSQLTLCGSMTPSSPLQILRIPVHPPLLATNTLRNALESRGISITSIKEGTVPPNAKLLATHSSPSVREMVTIMLKKSDNLIANALFKMMGRRWMEHLAQEKHDSSICSIGTYETGRKAMECFIQETFHLTSSDLLLLDGDGESRYNLVTPHQLILLLSWAYDHFLDIPEFFSALPSSGCDGTLQNRTFGLEKSKVRAKTGTMSGISSLCGYMQTESGEPLAFAILINGSTRDMSTEKAEIENRICQLLATLSES